MPSSSELLAGILAAAGDCASTEKPNAKLQASALNTVHRHVR